MLWNCTLQWSSLPPFALSCSQMSLGCDWQAATPWACAPPGPARSIFIRDRRTVSCVCYYQCLLIWKLQQGNPCLTVAVQHTMANQTVHSTHTYPEISFSDSECQIIFKNTWTSYNVTLMMRQQTVIMWGENNSYLFNYHLDSPEANCKHHLLSDGVHSAKMHMIIACSVHAHTHTCTHTKGPNGAPHVMLTQFRSVAQSRAGIQNKKETVTFKNRLTFFSSHC